MHKHLLLFYSTYCIITKADSLTYSYYELGEPSFSFVWVEQLKLGMGRPVLISCSIS